jgi:antitoxin (DNA-binding transcriptional repressor) of toxin-antitoxin stability system
MKTITVRDLRQRWPQAEALLQHETEILVTRDGKPVARLVRVPEQTARRKRFDPRAHARWQDAVNRRRLVRLVDALLTPDRDAR